MGFFDILYLGIFVILSPAFDDRFYDAQKPPIALQEEISHAVCHFHSLLHIFSLRFIVLLEEEPVAHSYIVNRMLGEFAAAAVILAQDVDENDGDVEGREGIASSAFVGLVETIIRRSYPNVFHYYSLCLDRRHKHFLWTGPEVQILPRSEELDLVIPTMTNGEMQDFPMHQIYEVDSDHKSGTSATAVAHVGKRRDRGDSLNLGEKKPAKRQRWP